MKAASARATAAIAVDRVMSQRAETVAQALELGQHLSSRDRALARALASDSVRWWRREEAIIARYLRQPLKPKDQLVLATLIGALVQLEHWRTPAHAVVSEAVNTVKAVGKPWAGALVNGVLRSYLRAGYDKPAPKLPLAVQHAHPDWLAKQLLDSYSESQAIAIMQANNQPAPLWLAINHQRTTPSALLARLENDGIEAQLHDDAISVAPGTDVTTLPGFDDGEFWVQDIAAQACADWLDAQPGERILDACAAPGGKTAGILQTPSVHVVAADVSPARLQRLAANLARLGLRAADLVTADLTQADALGEQTFDRILLDAPCTATGIIRRHPEIRHRRDPSAIAPAVALQARLLDRLWTTLKPGGRLVYATCSVLPVENIEQVEAFMTRTPDAQWLTTINAAGWQQRLPVSDGGDGFFYAGLVKA